MRLLFNAGFIYFHKATYHAPHLLEHLILSGGGKDGAESELVNDLQKLGVVANAITDNEHIIVVISGPARNIVHATELVLGSIYSLQPDDTVIQKEKQTIIREIYEGFDSLAAGILNYLQNKIAPSMYTEAWSEQLELFESVNRSAIMDAYKNYITTSNCIAIIAGPSDALLQGNIFRALEKPECRKTIEKPKIVENSIRSSSLEPMLLDLGDNGLILSVYANQTRAVSDHRERVASSLAGMLLFGVPSSHLTRRLRDQGHVYSVDTEKFSMGENIYTIISVFADKRKLHEALLLISNQVRSYAMGSFQSGEIDSAKDFIINSLESIDDSPSDLIDWYLLDIIYSRDLTTATQEIKLIRSITANEIASAIDKNFGSSKALTALAVADPILVRKSVGSAERHLVSKKC